MSDSPSTKPTQAKKSYQKPRLLTYGNARDITRAVETSAKNEDSLGHPHHKSMP